MSTSAVFPGKGGADSGFKRPLIYGGIAVLAAVSPFLFWPGLGRELMSSDFMPHSYCFSGRPGVLWTHVTADSVIAASYLAISITLVFLVKRGHREVPFHWMLLAFGLFIVACGATHATEAITVWTPIYLFQGVLKVFTAFASVVTAALLPFTVPKVWTLVQKAKAAEHVTAQLQDSLHEKEVLLREVHHRVKNNLAVICSLFYLESTYARDAHTAQVFRESEGRVHSMALVHECLYGSHNLARVDFAQYSKTLAADILSSYGPQKNGDHGIDLKTDLVPVIMSIELAVPCGLILNELISNAIKHGLPHGGELRLTLRHRTDGTCLLSLDDDGVGIPLDLDLQSNRSLGLRLVRSLAKQIRGTFELQRKEPGTSARIEFPVSVTVH